MKPPTLLTPSTTEQQDILKSAFMDNYEELIRYGLYYTRDRSRIEDGIHDLYLYFAQRPELIHKIDDLQAYLKISLRRGLSAKRQSEQKFTSSEAKLLSISVPSYEDQLIDQQETETKAQRMQIFLSRLTSTQKTVLAMRFYEGMSYEEISRKTGTTKRTVYNQIHSCMKKLRQDKEFF